MTATMPRGYARNIWLVGRRWPDGATKGSGPAGQELSRQGPRGRWTRHRSPVIGADLAAGFLFSCWMLAALFSVSMFIGQFQPYKPLIWAMLLGAFACQIVMQRRHVAFTSSGLPFFLLAICGFTALVYVHFFSTMEQGYGSALILLLGVVVLANTSVFTENPSLKWWIVLWGVRLLSLALLAQGVVGAADFTESGHLPAYVLIIWLLLAMFAGSRTEFFIAMAAAFTVAFMRPSTTFALSLALSQLAWLLKGRSLQTCCSVAKVLTLVIVTVSLTWYAVPQLAEFVQSVDAWFKQDIASGQSNADTRNALLQAAREQFADRSMWWGVGFAGQTNPDIYVLTGRAEFNAPIHSDIILFYTQGGLVGTGFWVLAYLNILTRLGRHRDGDVDAGRLALLKAAILIIPVMFFYISSNPLMMEYQLILPWYIVVAALVSEIALERTEVCAGSHSRLMAWRQIRPRLHQTRRR